MKIWGRKQVDIFTIVRVNDRIKLVIENESYMSRVENISEKKTDCSFATRPCWCD